MPVVDFFYLQNLQSPESIVNTDKAREESIHFFKMFIYLRLTIFKIILRKTLILYALLSYDQNQKKIKRYLFKRHFF